MNNKSSADVTVIIPYFKDSKTIQRAIDSVSNQTLLPKKIFIIDDFSNENNSPLKQIEEKNSLVKVFYSPKNGGPGEARNIGLDNATTKFVAFLDSDDAWTHDKLEVQIKVMEKTNAFISTHKTKIYNKKQKAVRNKKIVEIITPFKQLLRNRLATRAVVMLNTKDYRFKKGKRRAEDFLLWCQIILDGHKAIKINKTLAYSFKEHYGESGLTANINKMYEGSLDACNILREERRITYSTFLMLNFLQTFKHCIRYIKLKKRKLINKC